MHRGKASLPQCCTFSEFLFIYCRTTPFAQVTRLHRSQRFFESGEKIKVWWTQVRIIGWVGKAFPFVGLNMVNNSTGWGNFRTWIAIFFEWRFCSDQNFDTSALRSSIFRKYTSFALAMMQAFVFLTGELEGWPDWLCCLYWTFSQPLRNCYCYHSSVIQLKTFQLHTFFNTEWILCTRTILSI